MACIAPKGDADIQIQSARCHAGAIPRQPCRLPSPSFARLAGREHRAQRPANRPHRQPRSGAHAARTIPCSHRRVTPFIAHPDMDDQQTDKLMEEVRALRSELERQRVIISIGWSLICLGLMMLVVFGDIGSGTKSVIMVISCAICLCLVYENWRFARRFRSKPVQIVVTSGASGSRAIPLCKVPTER